MRSLLLDTNLVLLLVVGLHDCRLIASHKRTKNFTKEDYYLLGNFINCYQSLWITSYSVAEVSNLLRQTDASKAAQLMSCFASFCDGVRESHISTVQIFEDDACYRLGVPDTGILLKSKRVSCVLTADLDLYLAILHRGYQATNFNHLREANLLA